MGNYLLNAFRWSETVGPWEERPGHFNDVWGYWTDDGLGLFEFLQVCKKSYCLASIWKLSHTIPNSLKLRFVLSFTVVSRRHRCFPSLGGQ
jgi:hypothetical protein